MVESGRNFAVCLACRLAETKAQTTLTTIQSNLTLTQAQAEAVLSAWQGVPVACTAIQRLHGGMINSVFRLDFDREPFTAVIKVSATGGGFASSDFTSTDFATEARALDFLCGHTRFPSPRVYRLEATPQTIPYAFLLLETIPGVCLEGLSLSPAEADEIDRRLAEALLELHSHTGACFGSIAGLPASERWPEVFLPLLAEIRAQPEIAQRLPAAVLAEVDRAIELAGPALADQGPPTLIHGDIWAGNMIVQPGEGGWRVAGIVDPGLHYADVESELAYLEVFGARRDAFFAAYTAQRLLRPGYERRRLFYWLKTALLHVWLFGDQYFCDFTAQTAAVICHSDDQDE